MQASHFRCASSKAEANDRKEKPPTAQVDMEEIFRKVLEDASRALLLSNADKEDETATGAASEEVLDAHSNTAGQPSDALQHEQQQVLFSNETPQEPHGRGQFADSFAVSSFFQSFVFPEYVRYYNSARFRLIRKMRLLWVSKNAVQM